MDPVTIASGVVAAIGLGLAWRMYRRANRAEAEAASLRGTLCRSTPSESAASQSAASRTAGSRSRRSESTADWVASAGAAGTGFTSARRGGYAPLPNQRPWRMASTGPAPRREPPP